jgi:hypothetical protein
MEVLQIFTIQYTEKNNVHNYKMLTVYAKNMEESLEKAKKYLENNEGYTITSVGTNSGNVILI